MSQLIQVPDRADKHPHAWREELEAVLRELWEGAADDQQRASRTSNLLETMAAGHVDNLGPVAAGDVILIRMPTGMRAAQAGAIVASAIKRACPGSKAIGIDADFEVTKLRALEKAMWIRELGGDLVTLTQKDVLPECECGEEHKHTCPLIVGREWDTLEIAPFAKRACPKCLGRGAHIKRDAEGKRPLMFACACALAAHKKAVAAMRARRAGQTVTT